MDTCDSDDGPSDMSGKNQHGLIMFTGTPDRKSDDRFGNYLQLYFSCFNTATICSLSVRTYVVQQKVIDDDGIVHY